MVPEEFVFISSGYLPECEGICPSKGIHSHISGIDLVLGKDGEWYILEDNLRIPSGASYPMIAREICRRVSPKTFSNNQIVDNRNYADLLKEALDWVNTGGISVIMTPGRYNAAYFEHSYLAERTGSELAACSELFVENDHLYYRDYRNTRQKVGVLYRRISDEYLDPLTFLPESLIGIPNLMEVYRKGNVAIVNAPGNGVADDKGIYYFVPKMIRYYLDQEDCRNILKCGKYVERLDLFIRLDYHREDLEKEFRKLTNRLSRTNLNYNEENLKRLEQIIMDKDHQKSYDQEALGCLGGLIS